MENSSDEDENNLNEVTTDEKTKNLIVSEDNPWALNVSKEVEDFVSGYKKFWSEKNKENDKKTINQGDNIPENESLLEDFNTCSDDKNRKFNEIDDGNNVSLKNNNENTNKETNSKKKDQGVIHQIESTNDKMNLDNENVSKEFKKENNESVENKKIRNTSGDVSLKKDKFIQSTDSLDANNKIIAGKNKINDKNSLDKPKKNDMTNELTNNSNILNQNKISPKKVKNKSEVVSNKTNNDNSLNKISMISVRPTSGMWLITSVDSPVDKKSGGKKNDKKRKLENINNLFDDLEEKMSRKVSKKVKLIDKNLKKDVGKKSNKKSKRKKNACVAKKEFRDEKIKNSFRHSKDSLRPDLDVGLLEGTNEEENLRDVKTTAEIGSVDDNLLNIEPEINPENFIKVKPKKLGIRVPENMETVEDDADDETRQLRMIEVAFGDDDVLAEFS